MSPTAKPAVGCSRRLTATRFCGPTRPVRTATIQARIETCLVEANSEAALQGDDLRERLLGCPRHAAEKASRPVGITEAGVVDGCRGRCKVSVAGLILADHILQIPKRRQHVGQSKVGEQFRARESCQVGVHVLKIDLFNRTRRRSADDTDIFERDVIVDPTMKYPGLGVKALALIRARATSICQSFSVAWRDHRSRYSVRFAAET